MSAMAKWASSGFGSITILPNTKNCQRSRTDHATQSRERREESLATTSESGTFRKWPTALTGDRVKAQSNPGEVLVSGGFAIFGMSPVAAEDGQVQFYSSPATIAASHRPSHSRKRVAIPSRPTMDERSVKLWCSFCVAVHRTMMLDATILRGICLC